MDGVGMEVATTTAERLQAMGVTSIMDAAQHAHRKVGHCCDMIVNGWLKGRADCVTVCGGVLLG